MFENQQKKLLSKNFLKQVVANGRSSLDEKVYSEKIKVVY